MRDLLLKNAVALTPAPALTPQQQGQQGESEVYEHTLGPISFGLPIVARKASEVCRQRR
jgi:hypothetical protein